MPVDYRIYRREDDGLTKNDHFKNMLDTAKRREFLPQYVPHGFMVFRSRQSQGDSRERMALHYHAQIQSTGKSESRHNASPSKIWNSPIKQVRQVWLRGFGLVLVCVDRQRRRPHFLQPVIFRLLSNGDFTNHFLIIVGRLKSSTEESKQTANIERCESIKATSQRTHIFPPLSLS